MIQRLELREMNQSLFSAPGEIYERHIELCIDRLELILPIFLNTLKRILSINESSQIESALRKMILYHDLGKLTRRWQENLGKRALPSHSTIGASLLFKILPENLREPISFAVSIHHTDRGIYGENIERPDVQAILDEIVDHSGKIIWDEKAYKLEKELFPDELKKLTVYDLREMAEGLRVWAKGNSILQQHKRRLQAMLCHHILKLCDISAASERKEYQKEDEEDYYGGWLMVEEIKRYLENKTNAFRR